MEGVITLEYIGYAQVEVLLQKLPRLRILLSGLEIELRTLYIQGNEFAGTKEEVLYSLAICNRVLTDMPFCESSPGDKEVALLESYQKNIAHELRDIAREIHEEIIAISSVVDALQRALSQLSQADRDLLKDKYWEGKTWGEIAGTRHATEGNMKHRRRTAIEKIVEGKQFKVTVDQYKFCMNELEKGA